MSSPERSPLLHADKESCSKAGIKDVLLNGRSIRTKLVWETFDPTGHFKLAGLGLNETSAPDSQICFKLQAPCDSLASLCNSKDGTCRCVCSGC